MLARFYCNPVKKEVFGKRMPEAMPMDVLVMENAPPLVPILHTPSPMDSREAPILEDRKKGELKYISFTRVQMRAERLSSL